MNRARSQDLFKRLDEYEVNLCHLFNRAGRWRSIQRVFALISRLGDGVFWYTLMLYLALTQGERGLFSALHMSLVGAAGVLLYKALKTRMVRDRPFVAHAIIHPGAAPLDRYSFPSGHTLHAVAFTSVALSYYPRLAPILIPFAFLVALSRLVLGLHYPSDVLAGAAVGLALAELGLSRW